MKFIKNNQAGSQEEQLLIDRYRQTGDLDVLGQLYSPYMHLIYGVCLKYLRDEDQSKDAVMQIFEELIKKLRAHQVSNFKGWLYTLARNYCLMSLRSSGRHEFVTLDAGVMESGDSEHLDLGELREQQLSAMEKCMELLPEEQKKSVELFYLQQKCYKDISEITGFDINKVKSYIQNGKRNLKICIEKRSGS
ncbi:sigma-70 family RNA polymerase sigma factor [Pedobacter sp. HMF7647]|uniref:Sigma-70 family RNA polymerase sigma factor n=1 Tax=Hufsiella arboris TaxID=2695275 RepID=A0A7K1Y4S4_9SPHI|nr:sigma-70 family RNA polymerase sigma factor [Hufsiella arboris]MXV49574.1 sigma-70 family RNA polymerase sigma factor [Hufsiella arboris]